MADKILGYVPSFQRTLAVGAITKSFTVPDNARTVTIYSLLKGLVHLSGATVATESMVILADAYLNNIPCRGITAIDITIHDGVTELTEVSAAFSEDKGA